MLFNFVSAPSALVECPHWGLANQTHVLVWAAKSVAGGCPVYLTSTCRH